MSNPKPQSNMLDSSTGIPCGPWPSSGLCCDVRKRSWPRVLRRWENVGLVLPTGVSARIRLAIIEIQVELTWHEYIQHTHILSLSICTLFDCIYYCIWLSWYHGIIYHISHHKYMYMVCIYIYMYIHIDTYTHRHIDTYIYIYRYTYIHTYIHTYITSMHACIHAYMHTCIHAYMHTCIPAYLHTCIHAYMHTDIQTYRHTDIQTYRQTDIQTYRHTDRQTDIHTYIDT